MGSHSIPSTSGGKLISNDGNYPLPLSIGEDRIGGQGRYGFHPNYRAGMIIGADKISMQIERNQLVDMQPKSTMTAGIIWAGNCPTACSQLSNRLVVRSGVPIPLLVRTP
jgi:hypothetical protein